jgi:DNA-binding PadR family transcriptional regulator
MDESSQFLPVKSTVFLVLMAVADEPRHGYGIMQSVLERSGGSVNLGTGHLYRHIKRLLEEGLVEEVEPDVVDRDDPRRRYYQLTDLGVAVVRAESERLRDLVAESHKLGFV